VQTLVYASLKTADNIVSSVRRRQKIQGWDHIKEACFDELGIEEYKYQDLCEDLESCGKKENKKRAEF
jgi:hypothetical protein